MNIFPGFKRYGWLLLFAAIACREGDMAASRIIKDVAPFYIMELNSVFDVYLVQDTTYAIEIHGAEDVIEDVVFKIDTGILRISNEARGKWLFPEKNKVKLFIHADQLSQVWPRETCFIKTVNPITAPDFRIVMGHHPKLAELDLELDCNAFFYWNNHQCGGRLTLRGRTEHLTIQSFGLMTVDAAGLTSQNALIENNSKGDCEVYVQNKIEYSIRGVGNIYLHGSPEEIIPRDITSTGELIRIQ